MKNLFIILSVLTLTGCADVQIGGGDPSLANGVERKGGGVYSVSGASIMFGDVFDQAIQQCQMDGNKKLSILAQSTRVGIYSGNTYPMLVFRCIHE